MHLLLFESGGGVTTKTVVRAGGCKTLGKLVTRKPVVFVVFDNVVEFKKIDRMTMTLSKSTEAILAEIHLKRSLL